MSAATVADYVAELADDLDDVQVRRGVGGREVVVEGAVVAVLAEAGVELRLRTAVAAAALRTPDVGPSSRGAGWVRFAPPELDGFARDRAAAWLESAIRLVTEHPAEA